MFRLLLRLTMGIKAALPRIELYIYTAVLGLALLWAASWIIEASSGTLFFIYRFPYYNVHIHYG